MTFAARKANAEPVALVVATGEEAVALDDVLIGDIWGMDGQSNMACGLQKIAGSDMARL